MSDNKNNDLIEQSNQDTLPNEERRKFFGKTAAIGLGAAVAPDVCCNVCLDGTSQGSRSG